MAMTSEIKESNGLQDWKSERFKREMVDTCPYYVFFEDDDPRIRLARYTGGGVCWVVGFIPRFDLPQPREYLDHVGDEVIILNVQDGSIRSVKKEHLQEII